MLSTKDVYKRQPQGIIPDPNFLHDLYYGDYEPSVFKAQSSRQKELNQAVSATEAALRDVLQQLSLIHIFSA